MVGVLLLNNHVLFRNGLRRLLEDDAGIIVVGEADAGEAALSLVARLAPQVVLMDLTLPGMGGLEATLRLRRQHPSVGVVVVTTHEHGSYPRRILAAGAHGVLDRGCEPAEVRRAVLLAARGERYISQRAAQEMALGLGGTGDDFDELTEAEFRVLLRMTSGYRTDEIASDLFMSPKTVATYRSRIFCKLGIRTPVEATLLALQEGLIPIGAPVRRLEVRDAASVRRCGEGLRRRSRRGRERGRVGGALGPEAKTVGEATSGGS
ncbi:MAG: response regulator [Gammaproteobacteria bacterium]|nr:response regulator [Gammaproteobacteria bacterium]